MSEEKEQMERLNVIKEELLQKRESLNKLIDLVDDVINLRKAENSKDENKLNSDFAQLVVKTMKLGVELKGKEAMKEEIIKNLNFPDNSVFEKKLRNKLIEIVDDTNNN